MTLVELLIVVSIIGAVTLVISTAFITIIRLTPTTEFRIDDARSTRGLHTWLVRDVASTPSRPYDPVTRTGYVDATSTPAAEGVPPSDICTTSGSHVLFMAWVDAGVSYRAQYVLDAGPGGSFAVERHICGPDSSSIRVTGDIENAPCASAPYSEFDFDVDVPPDGVWDDSDGDGIYDGATVEMCLVSTRVGSIAARTPTSKEIVFSVRSRNGDT